MTSVDRTGWSVGPWDDEGDREQWTTSAGLPGLMVRNQLGAWCGYVAVSPGHPFHGLGYDEIDGIDVHWGLTYTDVRNVWMGPVPEQLNDAWWLGFDCAHAGDLMPGIAALVDRQHFGGRPDVYRDAGWVRAAVEDLARQLAAIA